MFILISVYIKDHFSAENKVHERSYLIFLFYIKVSRLNSVMFMGKQFQKQPFIWSSFKEIKKNLTPQNYVYRTQNLLIHMIFLKNISE